MVGVEVDVRIGAEEEDAFAGSEADQVAEHRHGGAVGPMQVVEDEQDGGPA